MSPTDLDDQQRAHPAHEHLNDLDSSTSSPSSGTPAFDSRRRSTSVSRLRSYATTGCRNSYLLARLLSLQEEVRKINAATVVATERLEAETFRADAAERRLNSFHRLRTPAENRECAEQESARLRKALRVCRLQLENAQKEIFRAQDTISQVTSQGVNKPGLWKRLLSALGLFHRPLDDPTPRPTRTQWEIVTPTPLWDVTDSRPQARRFGFVRTESTARLYPPPGDSVSLPTYNQWEIGAPTPLWQVNDLQPPVIPTESTAAPSYPPLDDTASLPAPTRWETVTPMPLEDTDDLHPPRHVSTESAALYSHSPLGYPGSRPAPARWEIMTPGPLGDVDDLHPRRHVSIEPAAVYSHPPLDYSASLPMRTEFPPEHFLQPRPGAGSSSMLNIIVESPSEPETIMLPSATVGAQPKVLNPSAANRPLPQDDAYQLQHRPSQSYSQMQSSRYNHHLSSSYNAPQSSGTSYIPRPAGSIPSPSGHGSITFSSKPSPGPEQDHRRTRAHPTPARTPSRNATLPNGHVRTHTQSTSMSMGRGAVVWTHEAARSVHPRTSTSRRRHRDRDRDKD